MVNPDAIATLSRVVDLTGLPDDVVAYVHHIVRVERVKKGLPVPDGPPPIIPTFAHVPPKLTREEFRANLDAMAAMSSGQSLPVDWSRADLYEDHD